MKKLVLSIVVLLVVFSGVAVAQLQGSKVQVQGYMSKGLVQHDNMITRVSETCLFPDGSTQIQTKFNIDGSQTIYPNCIKLQD